jgi:hypothetical protein
MNLPSQPVLKFREKGDFQMPKLRKSEHGHTIQEENLSGQGGEFPLPSSMGEYEISPSFRALLQSKRLEAIWCLILGGFVDQDSGAETHASMIAGPQPRFS